MHYPNYDRSAPGHGYPPGYPPPQEGYYIVSKDGQFYHVPGNGPSSGMPPGPLPETTPEPQESGGSTFVSTVSSILFIIVLYQLFFKIIPAHTATPPQAKKPEPQVDPHLRKVKRLNRARWLDRGEKLTVKVYGHK
ncbi:hypothetical protein DICA3_D26214 [Diutina catenulata]